MTGLRESIEAYVLSGVNLECWPTTCCRLRNEHRGIVDAVQAGDPELARERITGHIRGYYAESTHTGA